MYISAHLNLKQTVTYKMFCCVRFCWFQLMYTDGQVPDFSLRKPWKITYGVDVSVNRCLNWRSLMESFKNYKKLDWWIQILRSVHWCIQTFHLKETCLSIIISILLSWTNCWSSIVSMERSTIFYAMAISSTNVPELMEVRYLLQSSHTILYIVMILPLTHSTTHHTRNKQESSFVTLSLSVAIDLNLDQLYE